VPGATDAGAAVAGFEDEGFAAAVWAVAAVDRRRNGRAETTWDFGLMERSDVSLSDWLAGAARSFCGQFVNVL